MYSKLNLIASELNGVSSVNMMSGWSRSVHTVASGDAVSDRSVMPSISPVLAFSTTSPPYTWYSVAPTLE
jgi:hypothetical protein